jgi:hypothetical protein
VTNDLTIKLHVHNHQLWCSDGVLEPHQLCGVTDFFDRVVFEQDRVIRVLGVPGNVSLIAWLYSHQKRLGIQRIELAGPQVCRTSTELLDPAIVLFRMRQCCLPAANGGWHVMTPMDAASYLLARTIKDGATGLLELSRHPAWPALHFIGGLNPVAAAALLARVLDPRWHVRPSKPDSTSRLRSFLGLIPKLQQRYLRVGCEHPGAVRHRLMELTWASQPPTAAQLEEPPYFLWRTYHEKGGGRPGSLAAGQRFASFLRYTWLDGLLRHRVGDELFSSSRFFLRPDEIRAYDDHMSRMKNTV